MTLKKITIAAFLILSFVCITTVTAQDTEQKKNDLNNKIQEYEKKLQDLGNQKNSLSSQIQYMDTQISLTALRIQDTEKKVVSTQKEIELLDSKIDNLDNSLNYLSKLLVNRMVNGYKKHNSFNFFTILFDSVNASEIVNDIKYAKTSQDSTQKLLVQVQTTKLNFEEQKKIREKKQIELAQLEQTLVAQKADLGNQKQQKQLLLADTQNDEKRYQLLLQQALAEFNAIEKAVAYGSKVGPVKKGDPIALVGNSGAPYCSSGAHLHFEVRQNNTWLNPENYLSSHTITDHQSGQANMGSGSWDWPLSDPIIVEQHFGHTPWSWRYSYSGGIHTGIDMWSSGSDIIRAPADGTLYSSSENCSGATINIKYIDHGNGLMTFYLHVQS